MPIKYLKYSKIYFIFSGILILGSIFFLFVFGLRPGIDFTGGSILEIEYKDERPSNQIIREALGIDFDLGEFSIQPTGERGLILRMKEISEETHQKIVEKLRENKELEELRFESIGPVIGKELKERTGIVIVLSLLAILFYIAIAFGKLNFPAKSWQYGLASVIALLHDALIPLGIFSVLGKIYEIQITIPVIIALLTLLGYSINNTVVVFDRIRENLLKRIGSNYENTVDISLNQTLSRSLNTSLTTLFPLLAIFFFGGETLKYFSLMLILGLIAGTYSSFFLAGPMLVAWLKWRKKI
ncbi:MAG: protein translocase subunit SecF [Candidatus Nealsonbacteria bacterium]|jgi:preprotein translocase subunit SecF|nr:protein translocase subunit SecF [Candidatus Nealsonbacteria bacterium]